MIKKRLMLIGTILFVAVNFLLVFLDEEGKVERISYVNEWAESFESDMVRQLHKPAVLAYSGENPVFFDENEGTFQSFLVEEGQEISVGDPLFTYTVESYYQTEADLLDRSTQVTEEIAAIEKAMSDMRLYRVPENITGETDSVTITDDEIQVSFPKSSIEADLMKEQYLVEKEKELSQKRAELSTVENQLAELRTTGDTITMESPYEGKVKHVNETLTNPLITIEDNVLVAIGELTEQERTQVEEGMMAEISLVELEVLLEGNVLELAKEPVELSVEGQSIYPFSIGIEDSDPEAEDAEGLDDMEPGLEMEDAADDAVPGLDLDVEDPQNELDNDLPETETGSVSEEDPELLAGYHSSVSIILEESPGATVLLENALFNGTIWQLGEDGLLRHLPVETGLAIDARVEILEGIQTGELVATGPPSLFRDQVHFIRPFEPSLLTRETWKNFSAKSFVTGLIAR